MRTAGDPARSKCDWPARVESILRHRILLAAADEGVRAPMFISSPLGEWRPDCDPTRGSGSRRRQSRGYSAAALSRSSLALANSAFTCFWFEAFTATKS